jgi:WD40 repeat protein
MAICSSNANSSIEIYDTSSWRLVFEREKTEANRNSLSFSNDATKLLIGLSDCRIEVWDLALLK